jgi:hypothetical protein
VRRAQKNVRRAKGAGTGTQRQPTALANGKGNGVRKATGTERPEPVTHNPARHGGHAGARHQNEVVARVSS